MGIAVKLGEDDTVEGQGVVKGGGGGHRVLSGHGVDHEERVVGVGRPGDVPDLLHERLVDRQTSGGVDDEDVAPESARLGHARRRHRNRVGRLAEDIDSGLAAQHPKLLDGGRALEIGPDEQRVPPLLAEPPGQLGGSRRLPRSLQAGEQDDSRRPPGVGELESLTAEDAGQLLVDDLDDLLTGAEGRGQFQPHAPFPDTLGEAPDDAELDVGFE